MNRTSALVIAAAMASLVGLAPASLYAQASSTKAVRPRRSIAVRLELINACVSPSVVTFVPPCVAASLRTAAATTALVCGSIAIVGTLALSRKPDLEVLRGG
jgi:hypothetical protein